MRLKFPHIQLEVEKPALVRAVTRAQLSILIYHLIHENVDFYGMQQIDHIYPWSVLS